MKRFHRNYWPRSNRIFSLHLWLIDRKYKKMRKIGIVNIVFGQMPGWNLKLGNLEKFFEKLNRRMKSKMKLLLRMKTECGLEENMKLNLEWFEVMEHSCHSMPDRSKKRERLESKVRSLRCQRWGKTRRSGLPMAVLVRSLDREQCSKEWPEWTK